MNFNCNTDMHDTVKVELSNSNFANSKTFMIQYKFKL